MRFLVFLVILRQVFSDNILPARSLFILSEDGNVSYREEGSTKYDEVKLFVQNEFVGDLKNDNNNWYVEGKIDSNNVHLDQKIQYEIIRKQGGNIVKNSGHLIPRFDCKFSPNIPREFVCESHNVAKRSLYGHGRRPPLPPCPFGERGCRHDFPVTPPPEPYPHFHHHHHHNFHNDHDHSNCGRNSEETSRESLENSDELPKVVPERVQSTTTKKPPTKSRTTTTAEPDYDIDVRLKQ